jgi:hypothetical protein
MRRSLIALVSILALTTLVVSCRNSGPEKAQSAGTTEQEADATTSETAADTGEEANGEEGAEGDADRAVAPARIEAAAEAKGRKAPTPNAPAAPPAGWQSEQVWNAARNDWEPAVATDPFSNRAYELTTRYGGPKACQQCPDPAIIFRSSSDGGATWSGDSFLCACRGTHAQNDPVIAVSNSGAIYAVFMNDYNPGVSFTKSTDHGATWSTPIALKGKGISFSDKPWMAISPNGQDVYVAFNSSDSYIVSSHDGGSTFSARTKTNSDSLYWFAEGGAVAPNGSVYFSESAENQNETGPVKLAVVKSSNGGSSWTTTFVDTSQQQPACTVPSCPGDFLGAQASLDVDSAGKILLAYAANNAAGANKSLYVRTSTDGVAWSARTDVGQNAGDNGFPSVEAGTTAGDFRVAWQDNRNGASAYNTWYTKTTNGGSTWSTAIRLSDLGSGAPYKTANGYAFPFGDYLDIAVTSTGTNIVIWGEGPNYVGPGGTWSTRGA